jgi:hypothetical protein
MSRTGETGGDPDDTAGGMNPGRMDFGEAVGVSDLVFISPDGAKRSVTLRVGIPYRVAEAEWACPGELRGFEPRHADVRGGDSMQALCLAIALIRARVEDFMASGGRVADVQDGEEWDMAGVHALFGAMPPGNTGAE